jgi:sec-independent protein translocase protein TatC
MTLIEHIYEFRRRLGWALLAVIIGGIFGFIWYTTRFGPVPPLGEIINAPYCAIPADRRFPPGSCRLLQTVPFEAFMTQLKVGIAAGAVLTSPWWLYQFWAFIAPGLYSKERKYALTFVGFASVLFTAGALLAYWLLPHALQLLMSFGGDYFATALTADKYITFVLSLLVIFGVSFELPLLVVMLNFAGVLKYEKLRRWRRGIVFLLFVFAAFVTPGQDPFSMVGLAAALTLLFEISIQISRVHDRRKERARHDEGWDQLADDEAAPFRYQPSTVDDEPVPPAKASTDDIT